MIPARIPMKKLFLFLIGLCCCAPATAQYDAEETLLLRSPSISTDHVTFTYAGDVWVAGKDGTHPRRVTVHQGVESNPRFSPDGQWIAFSGNYEGNTDVYIVPVEGGTPKRLTYHPGADVVRGWHPDGSAVVFATIRSSFSTRFQRLYQVAVAGGLPAEMPMPSAHQGSMAPDGRHTAYIANPDPTESRGVYRPFKHYRGGNTPKVWIMDNTTYDVEEIAHDGSNNTMPIWAGDVVYFLSDRNHTVNVFAYDQATKQISQVTQHDDYDVRSHDTNGTELIYEQAGKLHVLNLASGQCVPLHIKVNPDIPSLRAHYEDVAGQVAHFNLSPSGIRAVVEARGELFTVPTDKGDIRNITQSGGAHERDPAWSPDGKSIAYFSDASGEYQLMIADQKGESVKRVVSFSNPTFYYTPNWSPDSKKITFSDKALNLYVMDVEAGQPSLIDTETYDYPGYDFATAWSPDSKWITYARQLDNHLFAVFVYDVETGISTQVTDGMSDAISPVFSRDGKYLFFAASTNYGLNTGWLDMSNYERPVRRSLYAVVLNSEDPSPFAPESDEEAVEPEGAEAEGEQEEGATEDGNAEDESVKIDFTNIDQRILALPGPARNYFDLQTAEGGKLFYLEAVPNQDGLTLHRFDMKAQDSTPFMQGINGYEVSANGKKLIYGAPENTLGIVDTGGNADVGKGKLDLDELKVYVEPEKEWKQMFDEVWRIERDFFYVENLHGADWEVIRDKYEPFLAHVGHREDLNYLFAEMMSELVIGHNYVGGGDFPDFDPINVGLLGADYEVQNGFYRFSKIYSGLNWNPSFRAPLTEPGIKVAEGDYVLAVNGVPAPATINIYSLFQNTVDKQTTLKVNSRPSEEGAWTITVVPISSEVNLRNMAWVEGNRKKVDELTDGRIAYVYMPNTGGGGYTFFNRYYFSQLDKEGVIIDERYNGGGSAADYVIDLLDRDVMNYWATREGKTLSTPGNAIFGPKAMIINEYAASGGDLMPFLFREKKLGKLIGKRTLGILVGIYGYPTLMDGGFVTAPRLGIFDKNGEWIIENEGVAPDIEVEQTPKAVINGGDPQLERAIEEVMQALEANPHTQTPRPKDPNRVR